MKYIKLENGGEIEQEFFFERLKELKKEHWLWKRIDQLDSGTDHVHCELTFETISPKTTSNYYESNEGSIISNYAFEKYVKPSSKAQNKKLED